MKIKWKAVQRRLAELGFNPGPIDGVRGSKTDAAIVAFKRLKGLRARPYLGPITYAALMKGVPVAKKRIRIDPRRSVSMPSWLRLAYGHLGLKEIPGPRHNAEILTWWERLELHFRDDETPWCAGFVNAMILQSGLQIPHKYRAAALGWRWTGYGTRLEGPALGSIMSITRPGRPGSGHMTFVAGRDARGRIMGLGGNQGNAVSINPYDAEERDAQYHWPVGAQMPAQTLITKLPVIDATGGHLTNEA